MTIPGDEFDFGAVPHADPAMPWPPAEWNAPVEPPVVDLATPGVPEPLAVQPQAEQPAAEPVPAPAEPDHVAIVEAQEQQPEAVDPFLAAMTAPIPGTEPEVEPDYGYNELAGGFDPYAEPVAATEPNAAGVTEPTVDALAADYVAKGPRELALADARANAEASLREAPVLNEAVDRDLADRKRAIEVFQRNQADVAKERAALRTEREALTNAKIDDRHWEKSLSTSETIASYALALAGGILAGRTGDMSVVKYFTDQINQDIETQKANLQHKRGMLNDRQSALADLAAQNGDDFRSAEALRLAMFDYTKEKLAAERRKYDPKGTAARELARAELALDAEAAAALAKADAELEKRALERTKVELDAARVAETARANRATERTASYNASLTARGQKLDAKKEGFIPDGKGGWMADPDYKPTVKPIDTKTNQDIAAETRAEVAVDPVTRAPLGRIRSKSEEVRQQVRNKIANYATFRPKLTELMDRVTALGTKYQGAGSERWSGDERAEYESLRRQLGEMLAKVRQPTGILTEPDIERGSQDIPAAEAWTKNTNPKAKYRALVGVLDHALDTSLRGDLEGYDPENSPVTRAKATDKAMLADDLPAAPKEDILAEASTPLTSLATPEERNAHVTRLGQLYDQLDRRMASEWKPSQIEAASKALEAQRAWMTPEQYTELRGRLLKAVRKSD